MNGIAYRISRIRIITRSVRPPIKPEAAPYKVPISTATNAPMMPTISEIRPPTSVRTKRSRPRASVPNQCSAEGPACMAYQSVSS
ncbi:Uncharacterised protein [Vibrio cholerae]|nr:Uncharacterised protein [Vibrio cholerae]